MPTRVSDQPIEAYRDYLRALARHRLGPSLSVKLDASEVVQQTVLLAHTNRDQFRGVTEAEWRGWLRAILANTLTAAAREFATASRDIRLECSLESELEQSSARMESLLAAEQSSPSEGAARSEDLLRLAGALARLPEDQRRVVELHHLCGLKVAEVAEQMGRSRPAVVGLLFRALKQLRERLAEQPREAS